MICVILITCQWHNNHYRSQSFSSANSIFCERVCFPRYFQSTNSLKLMSFKDDYYSNFVRSKIKNFPTDHIFDSIQSKRKSFINFLTCSIELFFFWFGECCRTMRNKVKSLCNWIWIFDYTWNRVTKNSAQKWEE